MSDKPNLEPLIKASHDAGFLCDALRSALNKSSKLEAILILDLINRANLLRQDIENLLEAHELDKE